MECHPKQIAQSVANAVTGLYNDCVGGVIAGVIGGVIGGVIDGETARLEARNSNDSVTQGVPAGAQVKFEAVTYDGSTNLPQHLLTLIPLVSKQ